VIKRPLKFKFVVIRLILVKVAITRAAIDIENKTAISRLLKEVLIVVILFIKLIVTAFIATKEIDIRFVLIRII
jgi:hypothetical protein